MDCLRAQISSFTDQERQIGVEKAQTKVEL